jgi:hypothetical protein
MLNEFRFRLTASRIPRMNTLALRTTVMMLTLLCALSPEWRAWCGDLVCATVTSLLSDLWILYHHPLKQGRWLEHCHSLAALNTLPYKDISFRCQLVCKADACVSVSTCSILRVAAMCPISRAFLNVSDGVREAFWVLDVLCNIQTPPELRSSCVPNNTAQVGFCASRNWVYAWSNVYVYKMQSSWNPNFNTLKPDRPQHALPAACVIAQQYSSATHISFCFHYRNQQFGRRFKNVIASIFYLLKLA